MITELIKKDFAFAKKWFLLGFALLATMFISVFFEPASQIIVNMIFYLFMGMILQRICYTEDSPEVKAFLKSLPVKASHVVFARYVIMIAGTIMLAIFTVLSISVQGLPMSIAENGINIIMIVFVMLYYSVYLFLFYLKGFYATKYANTIFMAVFFIVGLNVNRGIGLAGAVIAIPLPVLVVVLLVTGGVIALCIFGSIKAFERS